MRGGHGDNYYWQLAANVRRYKGAPPLPEASPPKTIRIRRGFEQWRDVTPEFPDHVGETSPRDFDGVAGRRYTNHSGRNDLVAARIARDAETLYFHVRAREALTPRTGSNWMWLLIDADTNPSTGWEGYDYIVNRAMDAKGRSWLEKNTGGWNWQKATPIALRAEGGQLHLAIPKKELGLPKTGGPITIDFKWADNLQLPGDVMDFYTSGDVAPEGRFKFRFATSQDR
jgi:hypothetical protein